jgi:hypothetical protein
MEWNEEESPTLREVGAFLEGIAQAAPPTGHECVTVLVEDAQSPPRMPPRRLTLRIGERPLPFEHALVWPSAPRAHVETHRGGARLLDLEATQGIASGSHALPRRDTLPYTATALSVCPAHASWRPEESSFEIDENERASGVRLRVVTLPPAWYDLTG